MSSEPANPSIRTLAAVRLDGVDVLRGFACLWVTYCHAHAEWGHLESGHGLTRILSQFVGIGGKGVDIFVVLSGFCLFYPVAKRQRDHLRQHSIIEFYRRRLNRICPVYFAAIVFALAIIGLGFHIADNRGLSDLWPHALFIQNMMPDYIARVDGPLWSVALEMQLYLLFPLFAMLILRRRAIYLITTCIVISVLAAFVNQRRWFTGHAFDFSMTYAIPSRAVQFVLGMLTASISVNAHRRPQAFLLGIMPVALLIGLISVAKSQQHLTLLTHLGATAWGVVGASMVLTVIGIDRRFGHIPTFLLPLQRLGLISFSFYVVHFPIMLAMQPYVAPYVHGPVSAIWVYTLVGLPVTLLIAVGMFMFVERYTINFHKSASRLSEVAKPDPIPLSSNVTALATAAT